MLDIGGLFISLSNIIFKKVHYNFIYLSLNVNDLNNFCPEQIGQLYAELNPCCYVLNVRWNMTGFWSGQRSTDFILRVRLQEVCGRWCTIQWVTGLIPSESTLKSNHLEFFSDGWFFIGARFTPGFDVFYDNLFKFKHRSVVIYTTQIKCILACNSLIKKCCLSRLKTIKSWP